MSWLAEGHMKHSSTHIVIKVFSFFHSFSSFVRWTNRQAESDDEKHFNGSLFVLLVLFIIC